MDQLSPTEGRIASVVLASVICVLALTPGEASLPTLLGWDKLEHLTAFTALTLMVRSGWPRWPRWLAAGLCFALGVGIELGQGLELVGRQPSPFDAVANGVGIGLGLLIAWCLSQMRLLHTRP